MHAMIWFLYNTLFVIAFILLLPKYLLRMRRRGGYRRHFLQRFGFYPPDLRAWFKDSECIWIHGVSVGEVYVAMRFIETFRVKHPEARFVVSVTTTTGYAVAETQLADEDALIYFPVDFAPITRRVLNTIRPRALVIVDTELWPNLIHLCRKKCIPVCLINGRLSDSSFKGYEKVTFFTEQVLGKMNLFCVQSILDRERLIALGAQSERIHVTGSAKYEVARRDPDAESKADDMLNQAGVNGNTQILLGGSTWPGEERILMEIYKRLKCDMPSLLLIVAPRHVERRKHLIREIEKQRLSLRLRSQTMQSREEANRPDVFFLDTTGELKYLYAAASVIFVGKSLTRHGGQNPIEAAIYGKPVIVGPNMENFCGVVDDFLKEDALIQAHSQEELEHFCRQLLSDPKIRKLYGERASNVIQHKQGVIARTMALVEKELQTVKPSLT